MSNFEESEEEEAPALLSSSAAVCLCPLLLQETGEMLGVGCQQLFERAFIRSGQFDSYGRAMFIRFCHVDPTQQERFIPLVVREYCNRSHKMSLGRKPKRHHFCLGCGTNPKAWQGLASCYQMMHPEVTDALLYKEARSHLNGKSPVPILSELEKLMLDIEDSGALDFDLDEENWERDMRNDPTIGL